MIGSRARLANKLASRSTLRQTFAIRSSSSSTHEESAAGEPRGT